MKTKPFIIIVMIMVSLFSYVPPVDATNLTANINPQSSEIKFTIQYQTTVHIEYENGGNLKELLDDTNWTIQKTLLSTHPDSMKLASQLNQKISNDGTNAKITDLSVQYNAILSGKNNNASIDYQIILTGIMSDFIIRSDSSKLILDMNWRGLSTDDSVLIDGYDINFPMSAIAEEEPKVYSLMKQYPDVVELLSQPLINADDIMQKPLFDWYFLFDPTATHQNPSGVATTQYSFTRSYETQVPKNTESKPFSSDSDYVIRLVQHADSATIRVAGFAALDVLDGHEILGVTPMPPDGFAVTTTSEVPFVVSYGLPIFFTVAAAIIGYFLFKKGTTFF
ncbi:MAG: hypothetical protein K5790_01520 [Nitrosopumilus sp.]|uniref:hypothetical protein n=1 Tax=Nitrosopumilus sp. TaxID=2024843 RepID=UPI00247D020D|nr:hypothetical protein [Nitrosopumilus sp.]MCV0391953.1 hypothetical protein [Nitrosopumilus sp.]